LIKIKAYEVGYWLDRLWKKETALISSSGILLLTTCQLAAKIFEKTPDIIPKMANFIHNYCGIIWIRDILRNFIKCTRDLKADIKAKDWTGLIETCAKVFVQALNLLLVCGNFLAAAIASCGFAPFSMAYYLAVRPIGLLSLYIEVLTEINNYRCNTKMIEEVNLVLIENNQSVVLKTMQCFQEIITQSPKISLLEENKPQRRLAERCIRCLKSWNIVGFEEKFKGKSILDSYNKAELLFKEVQEALINSQISTQTNLGLTVAGYMAMDISRSFPQTIYDIKYKFLMSLLWTAKLAWESKTRNETARPKSH